MNKNVWQNEIYYSLSTRVIVTPSVILSRCLVLGITTKVPSRINTPSKRRTKTHLGSPLKRLTNRGHASDDESDFEEQVGEAEKEIRDPEKIFYCKFAIDSRRGIFYTFKWERHRKDALTKSISPSIGAGPSSQKDLPHWGEGRHWDVVEKEEKLSTRHSQKSNDVSESDANSPDEYQDVSMDLDEIGDGATSESDKEASDLEFDMSDLRTPSKKRKRDKSSNTTPRTRRRTETVVVITPHSKVALAKRRKRTLAPTASPKRKSLVAFPIRYPAQSLGFQASMAHIPKNPWLRSMHALHVGSRPNALPCREEEYARVLKCVGELLEEGSGGCICKVAYFMFYSEW